MAFNHKKSVMIQIIKCIYSIIITLAFHARNVEFTKYSESSLKNINFGSWRSELTLLSEV